MMESDKTFNNIEEILQNIPSNYKILEETIDIDTQKKFFDSTKKLDFNPSEESVEELIKLINEPESLTNYKKIALQKLAISESVEAFRAIENYTKVAEPDLKEWAILSLQQSKMVMHSSLLGEQQVFISTGLGGKDNKLRYCIIFPYTKETVISELQKRLLKAEIEFNTERNESIFEEINYLDKYAYAMVLMPLSSPIPTIIKDILNECNQMGNFLSSNVMITNIKKFSEADILAIIEKEE